jgi:tetratricopeptide (TPR) repeat protein
LLNAARFSWSRFLPFAVMAVLWGVMMRFGPEFAMVWAVVLALNGQEWYQSRFGTEGRLGRGWTVWSTGGRLVTLALLFLMVSKDITGWRNSMPGLRFGVGYDVDDFPVEAAEFLEKHNEIQGNILNTSMSQGDILIWKASPKRKTFVDGRLIVFPQDLLQRWHQTRKALSEDDDTAWKPLLEKYGITVVMIDPVASPQTYRVLMVSSHWIPFYDDGRIVLFGRADAPASDLAFFKANRLDPDQIAYHKPHPVPAVEGPPAATSWIDEIFQNRTYNRTQRRNDSAQRWLAGGSVLGGSSGLPDPARCLLAIQDARIALSRSPDDWIAFRVLNEAYRFLTQQEAALLAGIPPTPENQPRISALSPSPDYLVNRFRQRITALNYAIQTSPPSQTKAARQALFNLNLELFQLYNAVSAADLGRDRLHAALEQAGTDDLVPPEIKAQLQQQHDQLDQAVKRVEEQMEDMALESQAGPLEQGEFARQRGAAGLAITKFAEAERSGISLAAVKPRLIDLYCMTGQPDKALDLLSVGAVDDPNLGPEPGTAAYRQGLVYYLLGNYLSTASLWQERAIPRLRFDRSERVLGAGRALTIGEAMVAANNLLALPGTLNQQATWEYDLAICQLEAGLPEEAAKHFTQALTLQPNLAVRPIAAYYLERMGKPVPPPSRSDPAGKPVRPKPRPSRASRFPRPPRTRARRGARPPRKRALPRSPPSLRLPRSPGRPRRRPKSRRDRAGTARFAIAGESSPITVAHQSRERQGAGLPRHDPSLTVGARLDCVPGGWAASDALGSEARAGGGRVPRRSLRSRETGPDRGRGAARLLADQLASSIRGTGGLRRGERPPRRRPHRRRR